jgi:hypothetical protein
LMVSVKTVLMLLAALLSRRGISCTCTASCIYVCVCACVRVCVCVCTNICRIQEYIEYYVSSETLSCTSMLCMCVFPPAPGGARHRSWWSATWQTF